jgi:hypothetical protein
MTKGTLKRGGIGMGGGPVGKGSFGNRWAFALFLILVLLFFADDK